MGLQFCMNLLSLSFFSINLIIACLWDVLKCTCSLVSDEESIKISLSSLQNVSYNSFASPLLPGDSMLFRESLKSFLVKSSPQSFALSYEGLGKLIWLRKLLVSVTVFCLRFLKRVS